MSPVEDQEHRFVASGIDAPVGMKIQHLATESCLMPSMLPVNKQIFLYHGQEVETLGKSFAHVIFGGALDEYGKNKPNFYYETF